MNLVFISPNFPSYFENFCHHLASKGINVLGIGDASYDSLSEKLRNSMGEYYRVQSVENYDEVYRACGHFIHKHGRIDFIESLNEYWLETEAKLRTDFNVDGMKYPEILEHKQKAAMKKYFAAAGVPSARSMPATDYESAVKLIKSTGYPIIAKPNSGVGAMDTFKINNIEELKDFFKGNKFHGYLLEEYIKGNIVTCDGIVNNKGKIIFLSSHFLLGQLMDTVNNDSHIAYYGVKDINPKIRTATENIIKAYDLKKCFFHFEFFELIEDKKGIGKKGDVVALEVNMRPPGGLITEVANYTYDVDVYEIWADMIASGATSYDTKAKRYIGYASRKHRINYANSDENIEKKHKKDIVARYEIAPIFRKAMGDYTYLVKADDAKSVTEMLRYIQQEA